MAIAVVDGALLQCTQGASPCSLTVTNHNNVQIDDKPAATIMDFAPGVNIKTFGACKILGGPCAPAIPAPWIKGSAKAVNVNDQLALLETDQLMCTVAGVITITSPMQTKNVEDA